ncbi:MAG: 23S rRNA (uracil(1939)-C(5))-methyltransferase RlmD [Armatimonadota bacterium]
MNCEVTVDKISYGGEGIARTNNMVVFIPGAVPGDKLEIKLTEHKKNYARAEIVKIVEPSSRRIKPKCKYFNVCGGCSFQNIDYKEQLNIKKQIVEDSFFRFGKGLCVKVKDLICSEKKFGFRSKIQWVAKDNTLGLYKKGTHNVIDIDYCFLADKKVNDLTSLIKRKLAGADYKVLKHIIIRESLYKDEFLAVFVLNSGKIEGFKKITEELMSEFPGLAGVSANINEKISNVILGDKNILLEGEGYLEEKVDNLFFYYSGTLFFQVNTGQLEKIIKIIRENVLLTGNEVVLDLYSGVGALSLHMAGECRKVILSEESPGAEEFFTKSANRNNITNVEFITGKVEDFLDKFHKEGGSADLVILDPPRKGCSDEVIRCLGLIKAPKIVYLSCNPVTLARDCKKLAGYGYKVNLIQPVDMFPQTYHVEVLAVLENKE